MNRICKVKLHTKDLIKVEIHYQAEKQDGQYDELVLICPDPPRREFHAALQAIVPTLAQWCDVPADWCDAVTVTGISISWAHDIMGATVTASRACSANGPFIFNAPHKPSASYNDGGSTAGTLTHEQIIAIEWLMSEADLYLAGERAQMELPLI